MEILFIQLSYDAYIKKNKKNKTLMTGFGVQGHTCAFTSKEECRAGCTNALFPTSFGLFLEKRQIVSKH